MALTYRPRGTRLTADMARVLWRVAPCAQAHRADQMPLRSAQRDHPTTGKDHHCAVRRAGENMARTGDLRNQDAIRKAGADVGPVGGVPRFLQPGEAQ